MQRDFGTGSGVLGFFHFEGECRAERGVKDRGIVVKKNCFSMEQIMTVLMQDEVELPMTELIRNESLGTDLHAVDEEVHGFGGKLGLPTEAITKEKSYRLTRLTADLTLSKTMLQDAESRNIEALTAMLTAP